MRFTQKNCHCCCVFLLLEERHLEKRKRLWGVKHLASERGRMFRKLLLNSVSKEISKVWMHISYIVEAALSWQERLNIGDWLWTPVLPTVLVISSQAVTPSISKFSRILLFSFFKVWRLQSHEITSGVLKGQLLAIASFTSLCPFVWRSCPHRFMSHTWTPASYISILHIVCSYFSIYQLIPISCTQFVTWAVGTGQGLRKKKRHKWIHKAENWLDMLWNKTQV